MKAVPAVSVILPFFNAEKTLEAAINSILDQTFSDFELLLINNNSFDSSSTIAQEFVQRDERIRVLKENQQGVDYAMNCGLKNARGKYIARMDADDISHPQRLEKQVRFLNKNSEYGLVGCSVTYVPHNSNTKGFERFVKWVNSFYTSAEIESYRFIEIPVVNPTILFRQELYEKHGGCRHGDFPEDYEMLLRYLDAGVKMAKLPEPLLEWHDYSGRLTRTDKRYTSEAFFRVKAEYFQKWSAMHNARHPNVWVWGAGRKTRQRGKFLEEQGLKVIGYIDIVKDKTTVRRMMHYMEIPPPGELFIVAMVGSYDAREQIREHLLKNNYEQGQDFMFLA